MIKLTKKDKRLLFYLDENARYSNTYLAKKTGMSVSNVIYRINRLVELKVIEEFYLLLNPFAFRSRYDRIMVSFKSAWDPAVIKDYCLKDRKIGWFIFFDAKWNFSCQVWSNTAAETKQVMLGLLAKFGDTIEEYAISSVIGIEKHEHNFLLPEKEAKQSSILATPAISLDALDKKILGLLSRQARMKLVDVATALACDYKTVSYRLKRLQDAGLIIGYKLKLNRFNLGYDYYKVLIQLGSHTLAQLQTLKATLRSDKRVLFITDGLGWADLEFEMFCGNQDEYRRFQTGLKKQFSPILKGYETLIPLEFEWNHFIPE